MANTNEEKKELLELRRLIFDIAMSGGKSHLAPCFSCLEIIYTLYMKNIIRYDKNNPTFIDRDRFILSKGHAGLALYAIFYKIGLMDKNKLESYLQDNSLIGGEPCKRDCEYIETATGSLGHGLSVAVGMALGLKLNNSKAKVYCVVGDGELQEGVVWEAITFANTYKLDNLIVIVDNNGIQKMDKIENIIGDTDMKERWKASGWGVSEVDGHDVEALYNIIKGNNIKNKPKVIFANTIKGKGVSIMENNPNWHMRLPNKKELEIFKKELMIEECEDQKC